MLQEFIKVCAWCKKIKRGDLWVIEILENDDNVSHGMCEKCFEALIKEEK